MKKVIYIAGPYTKGDVALNVRNAIDAGDTLLEKGYIPFVPHLSHFWHFISPKTHREWLEIDKAILERCDALLRLEGESAGADEEVNHARQLGIDIYWSIKDL